MWIFRLHNCAFHTSFWSLELDRNRKEHFYWMVALILHKGLLMIGNCQGTLLPMPVAYFAVSKLKVDHLFFSCSSTKKIRIQILQISNVHGKVGSWKKFHVPVSSKLMAYHCPSPLGWLAIKAGTMQPSVSVVQAAS
ncbi:hypothetical protein QQP08_022942 [Theobroma cacao]|nr:hypothetical protein QQP08_022942 [Theobroma cacao]